MKHESTSSSGMLLGMAAGAALGAVGVMAATQNQRQQWQGAADHPGNVQVSQSFSQGSDDDFSVLDDADDLPF